MEYSATIQVAVPQFVHCVHCNTEFIYMMKRTGHGDATSLLFLGMGSARQQAQVDALKHVEAKLSNPELCDPVPCPNCFQFQPYMHVVAARRKYGNAPLFVKAIIAFGGLITFLAAILLLTGIESGSGGYWVGCVGLIILCAGLGSRWFLNTSIRRHNPNELPLAKRQALAQERSMFLAEFENEQEFLTKVQFENDVLEPYRDEERASVVATVRQLFVVKRWMRPALFINGGQVQLMLPTGRATTFEIAPGTEPGTLLNIPVAADEAVEFKACVLAMRVHPEELRLE